MALSGHQFFWAFADTFGTVTAKEGAVIEEELQQVEIRCAQLTAEEKIVAQPRVEVFETARGRVYASAAKLTTGLAPCMWHFGMRH